MTYGCTAHLYIVECSTVQYSPAVEEEEESSRPCVECEIPRDLLLHRDHLMPPLEIGFERFEENELDHCCTALYCTTLYYTVLYYTLLYCTVLYSTIYRCAVHPDKHFF